MNYKKIGEFISTKRKEKNLTQNELAKKIGVTDKAVSKWERGLGCPDVSILEILAKELNVSVLELLKGREIENELINITEADDYVKESLKVSKDITQNNLLNLFSRIIFYLISFISIFFIIFTTFNYVKSNKGQHIYIDDQYIINNKDELKRLKNNIDLLNDNKGILTYEEQQNLSNDLNMLVSYTEDYFVLKLDEKEKYTTNDIMTFYLEDIGTNKFPNHIITDFMWAYKNHNIYNEFTSRAIMSSMYKEMMSSNAFINYYKHENQQYFNFQASNSLIPIISLDYDGDDILSYSCDSMLAATTDRLKLYNLLIENLLKAGDINE